MTPQIRGNLKSPNVIEYAGGVNRQFGSRAAVRADYVYRNYRDFYSQRTDTSTGKVSNSLGQTFDLALNENTDLLKRRYSGVTTQGTYRFSGRTDVGATYTLSRTWGNVNGENVASGPLFAGVSSYLKEKNKAVTIGVADPRGAAMYHFFKDGKPTVTEGGSITEGIGLARVTAIVEQMKVDKAYLIPDEEAVPVVFDLLKNEGLCLGGSSGINVAGAIRLARDLGPGHTIVTVLCDYGSRYQSKLFNPEFLRSKNLPTPDWLS